MIPCLRSAISRNILSIYNSHSYFHSFSFVFMLTGFKMCYEPWSMTSCKEETFLFNETSTDNLLNERSLNEEVTFPTNENDSNTDQLFSCNLCGNKYTKMCNLYRHQWKCGNKKAKNVCKFCSKKFYRSDVFKKHLLGQHSNFIDL